MEGAVAQDRSLVRRRVAVALIRDMGYRDDEESVNQDESEAIQ